MIELSVIRDLVAIFGVIAGFTYYVFTVRNAQKNQQHQLETRQAQLFMNTYLHMSTMEASKADFDLFNISLKNIEDWKAMLEDRDMYAAWNTWALYFEGVGVLVRKRLLDIDIVARLYSGPITSWWEKYEGGINAMREYYNYPRAMIEAEFLYNSVMDYGRNHPELEIVAPQFFEKPTLD